MEPTREIDNGNYALAYAEAGFYVFPLHSVRSGKCTCGKKVCDKPGKHPRVANGFHKATIDAELIAAWFLKWPDANIGCVPGFSGHVVVDVDPRNGGAIADLGEVPETWQVLSGLHGDDVRGTHFWFRLPEGVLVGQGNLMPGVDFKSSTGYVLLPPSVHVSGVEYEHHSGSLDQIAEIPAHLLKACSRVPLLPHAATNGWKPTGQSPSREVWTFLREGGVPIREQTDMACRAARSLLGWGKHTPEQVAEMIWEGLEQCEQYDDDPWQRERVEYIVADLATKPPSTTLERPILTTRPWTDLGNAERFADFAAGDFRYVPELKDLGWHYWDGTRWDRDRLLEVERAFFKMARELQASAANLKDDTQRGEWIKKGLELERTRTYRNALRVARSLNQFVTSVTAFDTNRNLLNFVNGTFDLEEHALREHDRGDLLSKVIPYPYEPNAKAKRFDQVLRRALSECEDPDGVYHFLQKAFGYALTGDLSGHLFFYLYGPPGSSKSTIVDPIRLVLGPYGGVAEADIFMTRTQRSEIMNSLAQLAGVRLVHVNEVPKGTTWKTSQLNRMVEGMPVDAKLLYADIFQFAPQFTLFFTANHQPRVRSPRDGIWRRIRVVPFNHVIPKDKQNEGLVLDIVTSEAEGILAWVIEGHRMWREEGFKDADEPIDVTNARQDYEEEQSPVTEFLEEKTVDDDDGFIRRSALYEDYKLWHSRRGKRGDALGKKDFNGELEKRYALAEKRGEGLCWIGVRWRSERQNRVVIQ